MKRQVTDWENVFVIHISDKGLMSGIFKEFLQFNNKQNKT